MAPRFNIWVTGWAFLAIALLCPVHTFRKLAVDQTDKDLTFDDEDFYLLRTRREADIKDGVHLQEKRQTNFDSMPDDEDYDGSGLGAAPVATSFKTYRTKFGRNYPYDPIFSDIESLEFKNLKLIIEETFKQLFSNVSGKVDVHVVKVGSRNNGEEQEVMMDITHEGISSEDGGPQIQSIMDALLSMGFMSTIPQSLVFTEVSDRSGARCESNEELCTEGNCAPKCDGIKQCRSGADELNCMIDIGNSLLPPIEVEISPGNTALPAVDCELEENNCDNRCLPNYLWCDGKQDCTDGTDESNCPGLTTSSLPPTTTTPPAPLTTPSVRPNCNEQELACDNKCITLNQLCDGVPDCSTGEDEGESFCAIPVPDCSPNQFKCNDGSCIEEFRRCDYVEDCPSNEDEENCMCNPPKYQCINGECIDELKHCDGIEDCKDGTDESIGCTDRLCSPGEHKCDDGTCIRVDFKCDGKPDCRDGSDERNCPTGCLKSQFTCDNGKCINIDQICNRQIDCPNGEDEKRCSCQPTEFKCSNGLCIPASRRCDGYRDCPDDGSDENNCRSTTVTCSSSEFTCNSGHCIDATKRCDQNFDCPDQSDESGCPPSARECSVSEFTCGDGTCIDKRWRCDQVADCSDSSDEANCECGRREFACGDGTCISESVRCDSNYDCFDRSDEQNCPCPSTKFTCRNGECVEKSAVCNLIYDCLDKSDEENCGTPARERTYLPVPEYATPVPDLDLRSSCNSQQFQCDNGKCIELSRYCNGVFDCSDLSDEVNCPSHLRDCESTQYQCDSGECIDQSLKCDNKYDCPDASDELDCEVCGSFEFQCGTGECVSRGVVCDGRSDCLDRSDEDNCYGNTTRVCTDREFTCSDGSCVHSFARCDGHYDCRDNSDELDCTRYQFCSSDEFECGDGQCISLSVRCDGRADCLDGSDERDCQRPPLTPRPPLPTQCEAYEFRCLNGDCVSASARCNGRYDCRDRSDELGCGVPPLRPATPPPRPTTPPPSRTFLCYSGEAIAEHLKCDGRRDCLDGSDESGCRSQPPTPTDSLNLRTYPDEQTIKQSREVVFQCRDEGPLRKPVRWVRAGGQRLPTGSTDVRGRLTMPNIQLEHSGTYYCEAQDISPSTPGNRKTVTLRVDPFQYPTDSPPTQACSSNESTCRTGECIPREAVCDGDVDCSDGSDEARCDPLGCEPNEFQCDNKMCISKAWICDVDNDCGDESDERNCDGPSSDDSKCTNYEFTCQTGDQCIPKSFHCDNDIDCQDGSDEFGCNKPTIIEPPPRMLNPDIGETFTITCKALSVPVPIIVWRLNWGHVPASCTMTSEQGYGVLTCVNAQPSHQGAYSCEAINTLGSVFAEPDAIVTVKTTEIVCSPPLFNAGAIKTDDCLNCFCFGITDQCSSSVRYVSVLPPPTGDTFQIVGVNQDQFQGNYVIREREYPLSPRYLRPYISTASVQLEVRDRNRLGGPSDLLVYYSLPDSHKGSQMTAYGGYLRYVIQYTGSRNGRPINGPDVILKGNNITIMHVHDYTFENGIRNQIDVRFWPGNWYKKIINRGGRIQSQEPASRWEILTVLENIELLLIRASYTDGSFIDTTLSDIQLDTAVFRQTNQGRAVFVEECKCPPGYTGMSCEECAPNYRRNLDGPYLGRCVSDVSCGPNEYGDPANGIPCLACPCPLTNPANQFSESCYLDADGQVTCNCQRGYQGRRCQLCAEGYEGNPAIPGESCQPAGQCDAKGSLSAQPDPSTGRCSCKDYAYGPKCSQCQPGSFHLDENNQYGCIKCFCMGITDECTSSNWYRTEESISFISNTHGVQLVDQYQRSVIRNNLFTDSGRQELIFRTFNELPLEVYYWKLPQRFLGDKITAYGGSLTFTLQYVPAPGGQSSRNNAYDVEIYGNDVTLRFYSRKQLSPGNLETVSVPFYEQHWQRQDGQTANREHFLMALADLEYVLIKATYTTNTQEVGLKEVRMETAAPRNTGRERAFAVEMCSCPVGYRGLSCEDCDIGYTRSLSGLHLGTCELCNCNGYSDNCDPETGVCSDCRDNRAGDFCEVCADGYHIGYDGTCERVKSCSCDPRGSLSSLCENDVCQCKANVEGDECKTCRDGHFYLSERNRDGCLKCWCSGVTNRCSSSQYFREQLPMNLFEGHGFTLADRKRTNVVRDNLEVSVPENRISYRRFDLLSPQETYYWSLPQIFTGNRLTSYGGQLSVTQKFDSRSTSDIYSDADIIITSADKREFIWMNPDMLKPRRVQNYTVSLVESQFTVDQRPATRKEFLAALASVEAILIRAQFSSSMVSTSLQYVTMDTAVDYQTGQPRAYEVEHCSCSSEYIGFSCEDCAQGYYRDLRSGRCFKCPCNGKEDSCIGERDGSVTCNCMPGFTGRNCGLSVANGGPRPDGGITGVVQITISQPIYSAEVGATIELVCTVPPGGRVSIKWDRQDNALPYGRSKDNFQGTLVINQVRPEDAGIYICRASTGVHVTQEQTELVVTGGPPPSKPVVIIEERKKVVEVYRGEYYEVKCRSSGSPQPQVQWLRVDNRPLPPTVSQQNGILSFSRLQPTDSGEYTCRGRNVQGITSDTITIYVVDGTHPPVVPPDPYIIVQVSNEEVDARPGEVVRVACSVHDSVIIATMRWTREQGELPQQATARNGELIIPDARPVDSGLYTCHVTDNTGNTGEATTRVNIAFYGNLPEVRIEPDRQTVNQGTSAQLRCIATGDPQPEITWSKVNEELGPQVVIEGGLLRINNAVISDRGMYVCEARNNVGKARTAAILEVERREPPVIEMYPDSKQTIEKGSSAMFQCHLTGGIPTPKVTWERSDGKPLTPNTVVLNGGVLRFNQVTGEEEGGYVCTALNDAGKMTATAILEIQAIPVITLRPSASPLRVQRGERIRLECSAEGDPLPTVKWQRLQVNFEQDVRTQSLSPSVSVYEVASATIRDQGTYQCNATNAVGSSVERIQVLVQDNLPAYPPVPLPGPLPPRPRPRPTGPTHPESNAYKVPLGSDFEFRCFAEGTEDQVGANYIFNFERTDGQPLPRGHSERDGVLTVQNIGKDAEGEYACIVTERLTNTVILTVYSTLEILEQPRVRLEPARQVVRPGDTVSLRCIVTGAQPITINWSKETGTMPASVIINGGELLFRGIATTDTGRYICEAINNVGRATSIAEVIVNERPLLTALQGSMSVSRGQDVELRCETSGINPASVKWSMEGRRGLPRNAFALSSDAVLMITNVQPENAGRYKCEARTSLGGYTFDFITLTVMGSQIADITIRPSSPNVRLGDPFDLYCDVDEPGAIVSWTRVGAPLPYNARVERRYLKFANVQPNNGGVYKCIVRTSVGVFEETYPLTIQNAPPSYGHGPRSVETRSTQFGSTVVINCGVELTPPVSFTWSKQGDELPIRTRITDDVIEIPQVQAEDAGTYVCTARNDDESVDIPTLLIVTGVVPRFAGESYLALPTLPDAYLVFDLEISFKPESGNGLILYNSQRDGPGDFVAFGMSDSHAEFRFDVGSGPAILTSPGTLALGEWHTVKLSRNRKEGTMIVDGGVPVTGKSIGKFQGLDLINPLYIGGVPDISLINDQSGFTTGFEGCVSRLVIGFVISELMRDARSQHGVLPCDTCSDNPCANGGVCQEAYSFKGHKCICPAGFSGDSCESTGESCYPGVCGSGRCVNIPGGLECFCPFGKTGPRCEETITIVEPAFSKGAYMAYPTPRALKRFSVGMKVKPDTLDDGLIMYCGQQERGDGDFTSLALRDRKLEFKFNTGTGTATLMSEAIHPGEWIEVHANRTDKVGSLRINNEPLQNTQSPGTSRSLNLRTPLFIGGVDKSKIEVAPDVKVTDGFTGCISDIELMDLPVNIADTLIDSSNVDQCGVSLCSRHPCLNGGICREDSNNSKGFICDCLPGFYGPNCASQEGGICARAQPCLNGGVCQENVNADNECLCPLGYTGPNCEYESLPKDSVSFEDKSWLEIDRYHLPQDGISDQEVMIEFSTIHPDGLLFWLGQDSATPGGDKDYISLGLVNGFLEFTFSMDQELVTALSGRPVNDGGVHTVTFRRSKNRGTLEVDDLPPVYAEGSGNLFSFNTYGNIYIGGTPDIHRMTGSKYGIGFTGCIHRLKIGSNEIQNFMDYALQGVNVSPCARGRGR